MTGDTQKLLVGLYQQKSVVIGNDKHRRLPKKLSNSGSKQAQKVQSYIKQVQTLKSSDQEATSPELRVRKGGSKLSQDSHGVKGNARRLDFANKRRGMRTSLGASYLNDELYEERQMTAKDSILEEKQF